MVSGRAGIGEDKAAFRPAAGLGIVAPHFTGAGGAVACDAFPTTAGSRARLASLVASSVPADASRCVRSGDIGQPGLKASERDQTSNREYAQA